MEIILSNKIRVKDPPEILQNLMLNKLRVSNPKFMEAQAAGRSVWGIEEYIINFMVMPDNSFLIPKGCRTWLLDTVTELEIKHTIVDKRSKFDHIEINSSKIKYRPYQFDGVLHLITESPEGVLVAPAGSGKTVMGLSIMPLVGQPTLWLTHTGPLADQAKDRAELFFPDIGKIGLLGRGKWDKGDILTIGMVQTLVRNQEKLIKMKDDYGLVVLDECLPKGVNILMLDGSLKDASEIQNGDVTTFGKVTNKFSRITDSIVELRGGWGKIPGTPTHKLPAIKNGSLLKNRNTGSFYPPKETDVVMTTMVEIQRGDLLLICENSCYKEYSEEAVEFVTRIMYNGVIYRCMKVLAKKVIQEATTVYDFTTEGHFFIANGVLSSNCHHCAASTFLSVVSHLNPYYLYGLTATPYRRDNLEMLMFQTLGENKTIIPIEKVKKYGGIILPKVRYREVNSLHVNSNNINMILENYIVNNTTRNNMIVDDVLSEAKKGHFCIVVSDRRNHCETLNKLISTKWNKTGIATGKYSKKYVRDQVEKYNEGGITVLIATFALLGEGFDVPFLDRAFITMPFRAEAKAEQLIGRIQRSHPGKKDAVVYDYVDINIGVLKDQFSNKRRACRCRTYNRLGVSVEPY